MNLFGPPKKQPVGHLVSTSSVRPLDVLRYRINPRNAPGMRLPALATLLLATAVMAALPFPLQTLLSSRRLADWPAIPQAHTARCKPLRMVMTPRSCSQRGRKMRVCACDVWVRVCVWTGRVLAASWLLTARCRPDSGR